MLCRVLGVSRSGYYAALDRPESERKRFDKILLVAIRKAHRESRRAYGAPRIHKDLRDLHLRCSRKRVARLMRQARIRGAVPRKKRVSTPNPNVDGPDLVRRDFTAQDPNVVWCSDIKQVWTRRGWVFLAVVLDLHSRRIVGHAFGSSASSDLAVRALRAALLSRRPRPGLIHHSDRGACYLSDGYTEALRAAGARRSLSRPGTPLDNAVVESFFSTLSREHLAANKFHTRQGAHQSLFDYIEVFYNRKRRHSTLGGRSPDQFERRYSTKGSVH